MDNTARDNMISQQIRAWNVLADRTLDALRAVRREDFVPASQRHLAFADTRIALGDGEFMAEPKVDARMLESLALRGGERVLLIGASSGYLAALLAAICVHVHVLETDEKLLALAKKNLRRAGVDNVALQLFDARGGYDEHFARERFDAVLISRSLPKIDDAWCDALTDGGCLIGIEGYLPAMEAVRLRKTDGNIMRESLFETAAPRLGNLREEKEFAF